MQTNMRKRPAVRLRALAAALALTGAMASTAAATRQERPLGAIDVAERTALERRIETLANEAANRRSYIEEDPLPIHIRVRFDVAAETLIMDADERLGPLSGTGALEDMEMEVHEAIRVLVNDIPGFQGLRWLYGGKEMYFWFPQDRRTSSSERTGAPTSGVLIDAGHGHYYHHGFKDWRPQRDVHNGILEDDITNVYATALFSQLALKGINSEWIRQDRLEPHQPSGLLPYECYGRGGTKGSRVHGPSDERSGQGIQAISRRRAM